MQLIDASGWRRPLRKNLGKKNCELGEEDIARILDTFLAFEETEQSRIFDNAALASGAWTEKFINFGLRLVIRGVFQQPVNPGRLARAQYPDVAAATAGKFRPGDSHIRQRRAPGRPGPRALPN